MIDCWSVALRPRSLKFRKDELPLSEATLFTDSFCLPVTHSFPVWAGLVLLVTQLSCLHSAWLKLRFERFPNSYGNRSDRQVFFVLPTRVLQAIDNCENKIHPTSVQFPEQTTSSQPVCLQHFHRTSSSSKSCAIRLAAAYRGLIPPAFSQPHRRAIAVLFHPGETYAIVETTE